MHWRTSRSKTTWYWPVPVCALEATPRPRTVAPALEMTACRVTPSAVAADGTCSSLLASKACSLIALGPKPSALASWPRRVPSLKSRLRIEPLTMSAESIVATA